MFLHHNTKIKMYCIYNLYVIILLNKLNKLTLRAK